MKAGFDRISDEIDSSKTEMVKTLSKVISIKSVSAKSGGTGETDRANFLESVLKNWGIKTKRYTYKDDTSTDRPSIVARIGESERTIWIVAHIDTVSEGDLSAWKTDPYKAAIVGDKVYGRGTNDDGQAIISGMYALRALKESKAILRYNYGLVLVANEEEGSTYGMQKLMKEGIFAKQDMFVVPDWGRTDGSYAEIGEKGVLWVKITIEGEQTHASTPQNGKNAFRYMIHLLDQVDRLLHKKYAKRNKLFNSDRSTFEMTKHEKNVDSVNILPGKDVAYIDCRVLPGYRFDDVVRDIKSVASRKEFRPVKITIETPQRQGPAPITKKDSEIIKLLARSLKDLRGIDLKFEGIGGSTIAAYPRMAGMQAIVWLTADEDKLAHVPNEYAKISDMVNDAKALAYLFV